MPYRDRMETIGVNASSPENGPDFDIWYWSQAEKNGLINEDQLKKLLDAEFSVEVSNNPPIDREFDPVKEFALMKKERREHPERFAEFKEMLLRQIRGWVVCRTFLERRLTLNPDTAEEELLETIERFRERYGFTEEQIGKAKGILEEYYSNRQRAKEVIEKFPKPNELLGRLGGLKFPEDINKNTQVFLGPMSVEIFTDLMTAIALRARKAVLSEGEDDLEKRYTFSAFSHQSKDREPILYNVYVKGNTNIPVKKMPNPTPGIVRHERQHQENKFFIQPTRVQFSEYLSAFFRFVFVKVFRFDPLETFWRDEAKPVEALLRQERKYCFDRAKDEMFACARDGEWDASIFLKDKEEEDRPYNYHEEVTEFPEGILHKKYGEMADRIFGEKYEKTIRRAFKALNKLANARGYSLDKAIARLTDESLVRWPRVVEEELAS